jgi:hypothetical protein
MPQIVLPIFPEGCTDISRDVGFEKRDGMVCYFNGQLPVFTHAEADIASFRLFTSQLIANGHATQARIAEVFGVPLVAVKRACKTFKERGAAGFYKPPAPRKGRRLTPEKLAEAQALLDQGWAVPAVSQELGVLQSTLHKAIGAGRLVKKKALSATRER